ncbi:hypothetical protein [Asticcacaulis sp. YBE204]|uniref:hypothetical protein n=1 Tax=Asticcacaulis sp. YBE204 TaxID=1282363 RepID=UPI000424E1D2|nr:hypothetical protein [Asticcacaulis sp. YBE204]
MIVGGVFAAIFLAVLFVPFDSLLRPQPAVAEFSELTPRIDAKFERVKVTGNEADPESAAGKKARAEQLAGQTHNEINQALVVAKIKGEKISEADLVAGQNDAPKPDGYAHHATVERLTVKLPESDGQDVSGMKMACFSVRENGYTLHQAALYTEDRFVQLPLSLTSWVTSGCAAAVAAQRHQVSYVQMLATTRSLIPMKPEFEEQRRILARMVAATNAAERP